MDESESNPNPFSSGYFQPDKGGRPLLEQRDAKGNVLVTKIRHLRELAGWTQTFLGSKSGLQPADMSRIERGLVRVGRRRQRRLAEALNVQVPDLFGTDGLPLYVE